MSCHFKCDKSLSSCCVYSQSVHNGGQWQRHDVLTKGFVFSLGEKTSEPRRYFARQTPPFSPLLSRLVVCEWEKTREKCSTFQFDLGQSNVLRLVRGPSIYVVCNVRARHAAAAKPQSTKALQSCDVKFGGSWRKQREKGVGSFELQ